MTVVFIYTLSSHTIVHSFQQTVCSINYIAHTLFFVLTEVTSRHYCQMRPVLALTQPSRLLQKNVHSFRISKKKNQLQPTVKPARTLGNVACQNPRIRCFTGRKTPTDYPEWQVWHYATFVHQHLRPQQSVYSVWLVEFCVLTVTEPPTETLAYWCIINVTTTY